MAAISQDALRLYVVQTRERLQQLLQRLHWTEEGVRKVRRERTLDNCKLSSQCFINAATSPAAEGAAATSSTHWWAITAQLHGLPKPQCTVDSGTARAIAGETSNNNNTKHIRRATGRIQYIREVAALRACSKEHATPARMLRGECQLRRAGGYHQEGAQEATSLS